MVKQLSSVDTGKEMLNPEELNISVHDHFVVSYRVECEERRITLITQARDGVIERPATTTITFTGVEAYRFRYGLPVNIVFGIETCAAMSIYFANWKEIEAGLQHGWPGEWAKDEAAAKHFFLSNRIVGFKLSSSCGLEGWILAQTCGQQMRDEGRA